MRDLDNTEATIEAREATIKKQEDKQKTLLSDRRKLLKMPEFQRVMSEIISNGGIFRSAMTGNSQTFYKLGVKDFTLEIFSDLQSANPELAFELLKDKFGDSDD